jgi:hypothetical protein
LLGDYQEDNMFSMKKMVYFTPVIDKYLTYWLLCSDTWWKDEYNFWMFVLALNYYSKSLKDKALTPEDPSLAHLPEGNRIFFANKRTLRNPRTCDETTLRSKILLAIERNHPGFGMGHYDVNELVTNLCNKAMIVLDVLWLAKQKGFFPNAHIENKMTLHLK